MVTFVQKQNKCPLTAAHIHNDKTDLPMIIRFHRWLPLAGLALLPAIGQASMGHVASNFGLLPQDVASAQSLSMFSNQPSAVYYNPAYLARDKSGAMTAAFLFTDQELKAKGWGTPDKVVENDVIEDHSNYNFLLGFKTNLSTMLASDRPLVLGFMLGAERTGEKLLAFNSTTSQTAQSLRYGQQSLFLSLGAGLNVVPGFDVGASTRITLAADANLRAYTDVAGNTQYETLQVSAKPSIQPILSGTLDWGRLVCPGRRGCWLTGIETAASWRHASKFTANVDALAAVPNLVAAPGLPLKLATLDSYQPETWSAAMQYNLYKLRVSAGVDYQLWSALNSELNNDTVKDDSGLKFEDVVVPRIGAEYRVDNTLSFIGGVSYEKSPLVSKESRDVNYVDNDRIVFGLGMSYLIEQPLFLAQPVRFDIGYQYHWLQERDFRLSTTRNTGNQSGQQNPNCDAGTRCEDVTAEGDVHVINASVNLKF